MRGGEGEEGGRGKGRGFAPPLSGQLWIRPWHPDLIFVVFLSGFAFSVPRGIDSRSLTQVSSK